MRRSTPILFRVTVFLIVSLACGFLPSIPVTAPTLDANAVGTVIMQTAVSAATQTARAVVPVEIVSSPTPIVSSLTATETFTLEPPAFTPTASLSPMPPGTNTPLIPIIRVATDTNCRTGPGKVYDQVGALMVGETAEVMGRDVTGNYWYIKNPDYSQGYCWLWGEYATVSGNLVALPVYTPAATPTPVPNFEVEYEGLESCVGWWVNLQLTNTGGNTFRSIGLMIKDMNTGDELAMYADKFTALEGCRDSSTKDVLHPVERYTVSTPAFARDPGGHKMRATITLCSDAGQNGACVTKVIKFTP